MKHTLLFLIPFCAIAMPVMGELTDADLNEIRLIVQEEVKPIKADIVTLKTDVAWIRGKLEGVDKQFEGVNQRITHATNVSYGLIALIVAAIAIPQIIIAWREKGQKAQAERIENLENQIRIIAEQPNTGQINTGSSTVG
ncbi:MAG: hypothetical protein OXC79_02285 [Candidatus Poribacteria bacterium]|nr:hypothetical protein [Candidatus Poribacteria bacterium]